MKKLASLSLILLTLSGCSVLRTHKADIEQGNVFTEKQVAGLNKGMTLSQVKRRLGNPLLVNVFTKQHVAYVYTYKAGYGSMKEKKLLLDFKDGKLASIDDTQA